MGTNLFLLAEEMVKLLLYYITHQDQVSHVVDLEDIAMADLKKLIPQQTLEKS